MISALALAVYVTSLSAAIGLRSVVHRRRTGDFGWRHEAHGGFLRRVPQASIAAGAAVVAIGAALDLGTALPLFASSVSLRAVGLASATTSAVMLYFAQQSMGASWRLGVDAAERTQLVVGGCFAVVRNPIYTCLLGLVAGTALAVPNPVVLGGAALSVAGVQYQVRRIEEPYLRAAHGDDYARYAAATGRFVPVLGKLRPRQRPHRQDPGRR